MEHLKLVLVDLSICCREAIASAVVALVCSIVTIVYYHYLHFYSSLVRLYCQQVFSRRFGLLLDKWDVEIPAEELNYLC